MDDQRKEPGEGRHQRFQPDGRTSGMKLLVTGGAGYIGSIVATQLIEAGHDVVVLDDLSTGHADAVPDGAGFVRGDLRDDASRILARGIDAVLHFAAKSLVGESVAEPARYWAHNLGGTLALLEAIRAAGTPRIVFSSTAAVYGDPEQVPIEETAPTRPASPYGASKLAVDTALTEYARMHRLGAVSLRYFNVAGAYQDAAGKWAGERHANETHLIPNVLAVALAGRGKVSIFGADYPTPDGTCVRDYIHVSDLARAHLLALAACVRGEHAIYNLGSGAGFSNAEVLDACREVTGRDIPARPAPRRAGDPAVLVASSDRIRADLGWSPELGLRDMVADAWSVARGRGGG
jgi:UDP-glucose 4-epimerase